VHCTLSRNITAHHNNFIFEQMTCAAIWCSLWVEERQLLNRLGDRSLKPPDMGGKCTSHDSEVFTTVRTARLQISLNFCPLIIYIHSWHPYFNVPHKKTRCRFNVVQTGSITFETNAFETAFIWDQFIWYQSRQGSYFQTRTPLMF